MLKDFLEKNNINDPVVIELLSNLCYMFDNLEADEDEGIKEHAELDLNRLQLNSWKMITEVLHLFKSYPEESERLDEIYSAFESKKDKPEFVEKFFIAMKKMMEFYKGKDNRLVYLNRSLELSIEYLSIWKQNLEEKLKQYPNVSIVISTASENDQAPSARTLNSVFRKPYPVKKQDTQTRFFNASIN